MTGTSQALSTGCLLRAYRGRAGLSQQALADLMSEHGWIQTTVSKAELDERRILADEAATLAHLLNAPLDWAAAA